MTKETTLAVHLEKLTPKEKGLIMWSLNATNELGYAVHLGVLPFVNVHDALKALELFGKQTGQGRLRLASQVKFKLRDEYQISRASSWMMLLNNKKVAKRFGAHPERGHKIPHVTKKRVTVGVRWSLPKRDHEPDDDVLVQPHVVLKPKSKGWWEVTCENRYRAHVTTFLLDYCS